MSVFSKLVSKVTEVFSKKENVEKINITLKTIKGKAFVKKSLKKIEEYYSDENLKGVFEKLKEDNSLLNSKELFISKSDAVMQKCNKEQKVVKNIGEIVEKLNAWEIYKEVECQKYLSEIQPEAIFVDEELKSKFDNLYSKANSLMTKAKNVIYSNGGESEFVAKLNSIKEEINKYKAAVNLLS